jgi:phosphohistidine phosphatase
MLFPLRWHRRQQLLDLYSNKPQMKKLYLIRHAKSSWDDPGLSDFERQLNQRGKRDAPFMAKLLKKEKAKPDLIVSSSAVRALTTAHIFAEVFNYPSDKILSTEDIYETGLKELEKTVQEIDDDFSSVFLFGHNMAITSFANHLGNKFISNMPTCSIVGIKFDLTSWEKIERGTGKIFLFEYPKKYLE